MATGLRGSEQPDLASRASTWSASSAEVGGPVLQAAVGRAHRFESAAAFKRFTGLTPKASETGETDRKGSPCPRPGPHLLRTQLLRSADTARTILPQLARIYHTQMVEEGEPTT